jgi:hypothetical protein
VTYLLFVDESGQDRRNSPYEVLAGAAIHDTRLWDFVCRVQDGELDFFGIPLSADRRELKAKRLLKRKTFRLAGQMSPIPNDARMMLAANAIADGARANRREITALAQAKVAFCKHVLELCALHDVRFFASIVPTKAPRPVGAGLRKDYAYLFERFFYFVENQALHERGLVVFDELERSRASTSGSDGGVLSSNADRADAIEAYCSRTFLRSQRLDDGHTGGRSGSVHRVVERARFKDARSETRRVGRAGADDFGSPSPRHGRSSRVP